jgi:hypothetical protein
MPTAYLFRIDGAKDNDDFFSALHPSFAHVYAGIDFKAGAPGWIPDFVKIVIEPGQFCSLTLIELEATESVALISCRKYLPENSTAIYEAFIGYLVRVVRQCRSTADPREPEFSRLKTAVEEIGHAVVSTAGALRSSTTFVEELPLFDQAQGVVHARPNRPSNPEKHREFRGTMHLSASETKSVGRCIMILDAVLRGRDHSAATLHTWRGQDRSQPLKYYTAVP